MKTPQDIINEEAEKEFSTDKSISLQRYENKDQLIKQDIFTAGATFALSTPELWREQGVKFLEWVDKNYVNDTANRNIWFARSDGDIKTTDELFDLYLEHLKTQQPAPQLVCRLDEQQCQQECEHKNNRANCPFISTVK